MALNIDTALPAVGLATDRLGNPRGIATREQGTKLRDAVGAHPG